MITPYHAHPKFLFSNYVVSLCSIFIKGVQLQNIYNYYYFRVSLIIISFLVLICVVYGKILRGNGGINKKDQRRMLGKMLKKCIHNIKTKNKRKKTILSYFTFKINFVFNFLLYFFLYFPPPFFIIPFLHILSLYTSQTQKFKTKNKIVIILRPYYSRLIKKLLM